MQYQTNSAIPLHRNKTNMKSATGLVNISLFTLAFLGVTSAAATSFKDNLKTNVARALQTGSNICVEESNALNACLSLENIGCSVCPLDAVLKNAAELNTDDIEEACNALKSGGFCSDLKTCMSEECPESCHNAVHAAVECAMRSEGVACSDFDCSPGFKASATIAAAVIAAVGWMVM